MACPLALWARMGRWPMLRTFCQCPFLSVVDWELKLAAKYGKYHNGELHVGRIIHAILTAGRTIRSTEPDSRAGPGETGLLGSP